MKWAVYRCSNCRKTYKDPVEYCEVCKSTDIVKILPRGYVDETSKTSEIDDVDESVEAITDNNIDNSNMNIIVIIALVIGIIAIFVGIIIFNNVSNNEKEVKTENIEVANTFTYDNSANDREVLIYYLDEAGMCKVIKEFEELTSILSNIDKYNYNTALSKSLILLESINNTIDSMGDGRLSEYTELSIVHRLLLDSIDTLEEAVDGHRVSIETGASGNELLIKQSLTDANTKYKQYIDELNKLIDKNDIEININ